MEKIQSSEAPFLTVITVIESKRVKWTILEVKHWLNDKYKTERSNFLWQTYL